MFGFHRVAAAVNRTTVANPQENAHEVLELLKQASNKDISIIVFPELTLTGYTAADLFLNQILIQKQYDALKSILKKSETISTIVIIGFVLLHNNRLYNTALVCQNGKIVGIIPKSYLPNKKEFYEKRQFNSGINIQNQTINLLNQEVPFGRSR